MLRISGGFDQIWQPAAGHRSQQKKQRQFPGTRVGPLAEGEFIFLFCSIWYVKGGSELSESDA